MLLSSGMRKVSVTPYCETSENISHKIEPDSLADDFVSKCSCIKIIL